ncbi:MAG: hypothetical protein KatS3mg101_0557 [Patescibacteria group bacterium]|nr:MAG: hypothetical protein KatS3mg101_0557 [Patescibacteria group bacterium]
MQLWQRSKSIRRSYSDIESGVVLKISQMLEKHVAWLVDMTGSGSVRKCGSTFEWVVWNQRDVLFLLTQISSFLHTKRRQALLAIKILNIKIMIKESLFEAARLADALASLNVRSRNRRKNFSSMIQVNDSRND